MNSIGTKNAEALESDLYNTTYDQNCEICNRETDESTRLKQVNDVPVKYVCCIDCFYDHTEEYDVLVEKYGGKVPMGANGIPRNYVLHSYYQDLPHMNTSLTFSQEGLDNAGLPSLPDSDNRSSGLSELDDPGLEAFEDEKREIALQREWGVLDEGQDDYDPDALDNMADVYSDGDEADDLPFETADEWEEWLAYPGEVPSAQSIQTEPLTHYDLHSGHISRWKAFAAHYRAEEAAKETKLKYKMGLGSYSTEDILKTFDDPPKLLDYNYEEFRKVFPILPDPQRDHVTFNGAVERTRPFPPHCHYLAPDEEPPAFRDLVAEEDEKGAEGDEAFMRCANGCQTQITSDSTVYIMTNCESKQQIIICSPCRWAFSWPNWIDATETCEDCDNDKCPSKVAVQ